MPLIPGKYQHYKNENIEDYFVAVGVPYVARKMMSMSSPLMEITLDGETMTIKNSSMLRTVENTFKLGNEYEEAMPNNSLKSRTTILNDNEIMTESLVAGSETKCGRHYVFSDEGCVVTLTHDKAAQPAKRYYNRVK